jgi:mono/diheme cytochrome c family protein
MLLDYRGFALLLLMAPLLASGSEIAERFANDCATCHGPDGRGDGPVAAVLKITPTDLATLAKDGSFPYSRVYRAIDGRDLPLAHGTREMPIWGDRYKRALGALGEKDLHERIDALVKYVETLQAH